MEHSQVHFPSRQAAKAFSSGWEIFRARPMTATSSAMPIIGMESGIRSRFFKQNRGYPAAFHKHLPGQLPDFPLCPVAAAQIEEIVKRTGVKRTDDLCFRRIWQHITGIFIGDTVIICQIIIQALQVLHACLKFGFCFRYRRNSRRHN